MRGTVCFGISCVDEVAFLSKFPICDSKSRAEKVALEAGGNALNCSFAASRLLLLQQPSAAVYRGIGGDDDDGPLEGPVYLVSVVGIDLWGQFVKDEIAKFNNFDASGISLRFVFEEGKSSVSFIMCVGETRTIVHTPAADLSDDLMASAKFAEMKRFVLENAGILFFDGRHMKAAIDTAMYCKERRIVTRPDAQPLIVVELENRDRPGLTKLVEFADICTGSASYFVDLDTSSSNEDDYYDAHVGELLIKMMGFLQNYKDLTRIIMTMGKRGSLMIIRSSSSDNSSNRPLLLNNETKGNSNNNNNNNNNHGNHDEYSQLQSMLTPVSFLHRQFGKIEGECTNPLSLNNNFSCYYCAAIKIDEKLITNSIGAGDYFNAGLLYGLQKCYEIKKMLVFASFVASVKIQGREYFDKIFPPPPSSPFQHHQ